MAGDIREPQRFSYLVHVSKQSQSLGRGVQKLNLLGRESRGNEVPYGPGLFVGEERPVPGAGQVAGVVDDFLEDDIDVEVLADSTTGLTELREPGPQRFDLVQQVVSFCLPHSIST